MAPTIPLEAGDTLVVLGADENLERLAAAVRELNEQERETAD
jgi:K+/H+ antiporter YhaU regulatory subunit KhtT